jgi:hypothetical protein
MLPITVEGNFWLRRMSIRSSALDASSISNNERKGNRAQAEAEIRNLVRTQHPAKTVYATLTREGKELLHRGRGEGGRQVYYAHFLKPRERRHSAQDDALTVVDGKIPLPDLRVEYETADREQTKVDVELATADYHRPSLAAKVRAGYCDLRHERGPRPSAPGPRRS